jgi:hypothetical protein
MGRGWQCPRHTDVARPDGRALCANHDVRGLVRTDFGPLASYDVKKIHECMMVLRDGPHRNILTPVSPIWNSSVAQTRRRHKDDERFVSSQL